MGFWRRLWYGNEQKAPAAPEPAKAALTEEQIEEEIKEAIHKAAKSNLYIYGDSRTFDGSCIRFVMPSMIKDQDMKVLEREAIVGNPEAQWVWALRYLVGYADADDLPYPGLVGQRVVNAAKKGVLGAQLYLVDHFKHAGNEDAALTWLAEASALESVEAAVISLEWRLEGYHYEQDPVALDKLIFLARKDVDRAKWYLDRIGIDYKTE